MIATLMVLLRQQLGLALALAALILLAGEAWILIQLLGQNGRLLVRLETLELVVMGGAAPGLGGANAAPPAGLPVGTLAPKWSLTGLFGETLTLDALRSTGRPVLLAFTSPSCAPCATLLPDLGRWQRDLATTLTLALISSGTPEENRAKTAEHGLTQVLLQQDSEVMQAYQAAGTPSAVVVSPDGNIGSPLAQGSEEIRALVARLSGGGIPAPLPLLPYPPAVNGAAANAAPAMPPGPEVGAAAPDLKLPDLAGNEVDLAEYRGKETLVLFWNPACGFCQKMLPELKNWEAKRSAKAPALLVVSAGTAEANEEQGLESTILLDPSFGAAQSFGLMGTPSAVLVDGKGRLAAPAAVGATAVLSLARGDAKKS